MKRRFVTVLSIGALIASGTGVSAVARPAEVDPGGGVFGEITVGPRDAVNLAADGLLHLTLFSSERGDIGEIDPSTVRVSDNGSEAPGASVARHPDGSPIATTADVDGDGQADLVIHLDADDLRGAGGVSASTTELEVSAALADGRRISDTAAVQPEVRLEIKFDESLRVRGEGSTLRSAQGARSLQDAGVQRINEVLEGYGEVELTPLVEGLPAQRMETMASRATASGEPAPDMASWYTLTLSGEVDVDGVLDRLQAMPEVVHAYPSPEPTPPPQHVDTLQETEPVEPTVTPDFTDMQGYFGPAPHGIDAEFSRQDPRTRGAGIKIVDLEYDWHPTHEDLGLTWEGTDLGGAAYPRYSYYGADHGTAVFGELVALDNDFGVTGGVPDAEMYGISPMTSRGGYSPAAALTYLAGLQDENGEPFLEPGDAVLLEQQSGGPINGAYAPITWIASTFEAVQLLSSKGINVIEAGGNGGTSLDHPAYTRNGIAWFDRDVQTSGSILVGAGRSTSRDRMGFSSHGSRLDLQGWGQNITTTGYGNLWGGDDLDRQYSRSFSGTSGASPIVTTAVVALQSYMAATGQDPMTTDEIVEVLRATGTPQPETAVHEPIGPLPNLRAALKAIEVDTPTTSMTLNQSPAADGTYAGLVIFLSAEDGWGSGVDYIEYRVDGGAWTRYDNRFRVTGLGEHTVEYRAVDANGNTEETHSFTFVSRTR